MKHNPVPNLLLLLLLIAAATAQVAQSDQPGVSQPVPYSSISQLNLLLAQLEQAAQTTQVDLAKLRIEKWKTDSGTKRQSQANADSVQRNLQNALPGIVAELRTAPENLTSTFKLYRNLDALYVVFSSVVASADAFGSRDESQSLENDLTALERSRRSFADRMETLAGAKEVELTRLRSELRNTKAAAPPAPPKKIVVDDNEPPKKPVKKKPATPAPAAAKPAATATPPPK
jgi:hypothetical protein